MNQVSSDLHNSARQAAAATLMHRSTGHPSVYHCKTPCSPHSPGSSFYLAEKEQQSKQLNTVELCLLYCVVSHTLY
jgi:hypothetical protein